MSGKFIKEVLIDTHECRTPSLWRWKHTLLDTGTLWQCDDCDTIWELNITRYFDAVERKWYKTDMKPTLSPTVKRKH